MNIAILNEVFLQPEHIAELEKLGTVTVYEHSETEDTVIERAKGAEVVIADCWKAPLNQNVFRGLTDTKLVCIGSTGFNSVDIEASRQQGILVANVPGFSTEAVAEHAFALILAVTRHILTGDVAMRKAPFILNPASEEQKRFLGMNLQGKVLGLVGLGQIGRRVAEIGQAFGMQVIAYNRTPRDVEGIRQVSLEKLVSESDVVSLHLALNDETKEIINKDTLALMKSTAYLINTARSGLVAEPDLIDVLQRGVFAGAGLDVITNMTPENPLLLLDNVVLTPHTAFFTEAALENLADIIVSNVRSYVAGTPESIVN